MAKDGTKRPLFDPPRPARMRLGYPLFRVEYNGFTFSFASLNELRRCIDVLGQKNLPRPSELARRRSASRGRANSHWLSRLPSTVKSWRYRQGAVDYLSKALLTFERALRE